MCPTRVQVLYKFVNIQCPVIILLLHFSWHLTWIRKCAACFRWNSKAIRVRDTAGKVWPSSTVVTNGADWKTMLPPMWKDLWVFLIWWVHGYKCLLWPLWHWRTEGRYFLKWQINRYSEVKQLCHTVSLFNTGYNYDWTKVYSVLQIVGIFGIFQDDQSIFN